MKLIEIAVFSIESAIAAYKAGANRLELCENYENGGTTPSYGYLKTVRQKIDLPLFVMICPRAGDFVYTDAEFAAMQADVKLCKQMGFDGVVIGILKTDGSIDIARTQQLAALAYPMEVTFHRAFDRCKQPLEAMENIIQCGCQRILTSGQQPNALLGKALIQKLIVAASDRIVIVPGGGIRSSNLEELLLFTGTDEVHSSAKKLEPSPMQFWVDAMQDKSERIMVDASEIAALKQILQQC
ncbi:MAG: copper homeostasis protein CutC [Hydrotalea sp. AMD]|uniref:copper homeostasis protein CutC n=1 Tax=Hydrotalea TaxID=1004300 RepID=UPI0009448DCF|nr:MULTISPECIES: copper homeostasis protein CutC [Hydrotalea]RWZ90627.1 MAG: copper homeostasis protein CutC [Hydrotalea sp. AMD]